MSIAKRKKYAFYTLGCRANQYQADTLKSRLLTTNNCQLTTFSDLADVYVINTCTVTLDAERKSRQAIRRALRQNPKASVIVAGCYAKLEAEYLKGEFPRINLTPLIPLSIIAGEGKTPTIVGEGVRIRQNLMIQDGCEQFCTYCIVPYARGKIKSKPSKEVITEARKLIAAGAREIILCGINLGTYQDNFSQLITSLAQIKKLLRIRLSSLEPMYFTKELVDTIAKTPKVCHYLHIPLQSGDDQVLKSMGRPYSKKQYLELISYIRERIPDCGLGTDLIVGFPGEGNQEYQNTIDLINKIKFSRLHIFSYSPRPGTAAALLPNQVADRIKKDRNKQLHKLGQKLMEEFAQQYLNKQVEILVEQQGEGLTSNYLRCFFTDHHNSTGQLKTLTVKSITSSGEIVGSFSC